MQVEQEGLAVFDQAIGILEVGVALADGLDLGSAEGDAGFKLFQEEVVVAGHAVVGRVALAAGDGVAGADGFLGAGVWVLHDDVAGLAGHASSCFDGSTGVGFGLRVDGTAPTGLNSYFGHLFPTLKRGANQRCAYGAMEIGNGGALSAMEMRTRVIDKMNACDCVAADVVFRLAATELC